MNGHWDITWAVWLLFTLGSFGLIEGDALVTNHVDRTLSDRLRAWLGIRPRKWWRFIGATIFITFMGWFGPHILLG